VDSEPETIFELHEEKLAMPGVERSWRRVRLSIRSFVEIFSNIPEFFTSTFSMV